MATLIYQSAKTTGLAVTLAAAAGGGDAIKPRNNGCVIFKNGDATATTITVVTPGVDQYAQARPDPTFSVAAGATAVFGPLPKDLADPTTGLVSFTYSKVTSLTVGAFTV